MPEWYDYYHVWADGNDHHLLFGDPRTLNEALSEARRLAKLGNCSKVQIYGIRHGEKRGHPLYAGEIKNGRIRWWMENGQVKVRIPTDLFYSLLDSAKSNDRSIVNEIISILQEHFETGKTPE